MKKIQLLYTYWAKNSILAAFTLLVTLQITAQPFIDIVNIKYTNSPNAGLINHSKNEIIIQYWGLSTNFPIQFKNKKDALILSPFVEEWSSKINNQNRQSYYSIAVPVSLIKTIPYSRWSYLLNGVVRMNDSIINEKGKIQVGGALMFNYKSNEKLTWKMGIYINNELFNVFVMPLAGIEWNINGKNNLFGVLPGNLTYEHKINQHFYYGAAFRAITNSYARTIGYWRIDENQLGLYLDTYFTKYLVLNIEAGHSMFRKIRTGEKHTSRYDLKVNDNYYFKITFSYRIRFKNIK